MSITSGFVMNEDVAAEILESLAIVSPFPILISIDQLEHIDLLLSEDNIINMLEAIVNLVERSPKSYFF